METLNFPIPQNLGIRHQQSVIHLQRPQEKRLCLGVTSLGLVEKRQIVDASCQVGVTVGVVVFGVAFLAHRHARRKSDSALA